MEDLIPQCAREAAKRLHENISRIEGEADVAGQLYQDPFAERQEWERLASAIIADSFAPLRADLDALRARAERAEAERDEARGLRDEARANAAGLYQMLVNLCCRIFRDGGQRFGQIGDLCRAVAEADETVAATFHERDAMHSHLAELRAVVEKQREGIEYALGCERSIGAHDSTVGRNEPLIAKLEAALAAPSASPTNGGQANSEGASK